MHCTRSRSTQVNFDNVFRKLAKTKEIGTQYENDESLNLNLTNSNSAAAPILLETEYKEKVDKVEINRVLLSGNQSSKRDFRERIGLPKTYI